MRENGLLDVPDDLVKASIALGAGLGFSRLTCGALAGGGLALGYRFGRKDLKRGRKPAWSRMARLVERFTERFGTASCEEITKAFKVTEFSSRERIGLCIGVIDFVTTETARLLDDPDDDFRDTERQSYFDLRESGDR